MPDLNILIDMKQNRIRIHKPTLRALGSPHYLSLVINPEEYTLGITAGSADDRTAHRISTSVLHTKECCELHSTSLIQALLQLCPAWHNYGKYLMTGQLIPEANMIRFDMRSAVFEETKGAQGCSTRHTR